MPRFSRTDFLGYIDSCVDITERKAAEDGLRNLSGQLIRAREDECARIARDYIIPESKIALLVIPNLG
jgi:hypothetical protein